jgi:tetratricopeptide (TPR) repeat protein
MADLLLRELVEDLRRGRGGCLVVERHAAEDAPLEEPVDLRTVRVRAVVDEQLLAYAALTELCEPLVALLDELPPVQARALEGALALGPPGGDALAVAAGFRSLLHVAAAREPLLVVVDDAHLLDRGTAAVVAYVARRLGTAPLGIAVAQDPRHAGAMALPGARRIKVGGGSTADRPAGTAASVARALERALRRGSVADLAAAHDAEAAATSGPARVGALLEAGQSWLDAGQVERAHAQADAARAEADGPAHAARADLLLGRVHTVLGDGHRSAHHLHAAMATAGADHPEVAAGAALLLVPSAMFAGRVEDATAALADARRHLESGGLADDHDLRRLHRAAEAAVAMATGAGEDLAPILDLASDSGTRPSVAGDLSFLVTTVALPLIWVERFEEAAALLRDLIDGLRRSGAIGALPMPLCALSVAERRIGRPTRALILASEAQDLAEQMGHRAALMFAYAEQANVHSVFGDVDRCRAATDRILGPGGVGRGALRTSALSALATVEVWSGEAQSVIDLLEPLVRDGDPLSPAVTLYQQTLLTAYVAVGRRDDALPLLERITAVTPPDDGRLRAMVARCEALLAPPEERDARFAAAVERASAQPVTEGLTRFLWARRLLAEGEQARGIAMLRALAEEREESFLGAARASRALLGRLGVPTASADPRWAQLGPEALEVALAAVERTPVLELADRLRLSPPEVEQLRDDVLAVVGARSGPAVEQAMQLTGVPGPSPTHAVEVRLLGGLDVLVAGRPVALPLGAPSRALALVALRRTVHIEELTEVLWPETAPDVARRRLRNVLTRIRQAAGPIVVRRGERVELAPEVVVDHHVLETRVRRLLSVPPGPERAQALVDVLEADAGPLLPGFLYEDWTAPARHRAEVRREEVLRALDREAEAS